MLVEFDVYTCEVVATYYYNSGKKAIHLIDHEDGYPVAQATTCIDEIEVEPDQIIIKDYAENTGIAEALIEAGIINKEPDVVYADRYVTFPVYSLTDEGKLMWKEETQ
jgi:hypothetical protein